MKTVLRAAASAVAISVTSLDPRLSGKLEPEVAEMIGEPAGGDERVHLRKDRLGRRLLLGGRAMETTHLGKATSLPASPEEAKLDYVPNPRPKSRYLVRFAAPEGPIELPVKLRVSESIFVPLAKWSMLLAGNYRCITPDGMRTAQEAVHSDIETSRSVYNFVFDLCVKLGAAPGDLVPFEKYAAAAQSLVLFALIAVITGIQFLFQRSDAGRHRGLGDEQLLRGARHRLQRGDPVEGFDKTQVHDRSLRAHHRKNR